MKKLIKKASKLFMHYESSFFIKTCYLLLGSLFFPTLLASVLLILNINLFVLEYIIAILLLILTYYLLFYDSKKKRDFYIPVIVTAILIIISLMLSSIFYDGSWDGLAYHLPSVIKLNYGWNPIYQHFDNSSIINIWSEHYPKFIWIYGGLVYKLTGNIFSPTSFNLILSFATFFLVYDIVKKNNLKKIAILGSLIIAFNITSVGQLFTMYNDGIIALCIISIILIYYAILKDYFKVSEVFHPIIIILTSYLSILANVKFTGTLFAFILFIIYTIICLYKKKFIFNKFFWLYVAVVGVSVLAIAINTFLPNFLYHHNIGYPIIGKNKIDIITPYTPEYVKNNGKIKSFIKSFTADSNYVGYKYNIFYLVNKTDIICAASNDCKKNGFGPFYQIIIITTFVLIVFYIIKEYIIRHKLHIKILLNDIKNSWIELISLGIMLLFFFLTPATWWSRYIPYMYLFPLMIILFFDIDFKKLNIYSITSCLIIIFYGLTTCISLEYRLNNSYKYTVSVMQEIRDLRKIYSENGKLLITNLNKQYNYKAIVTNEILSQNSIIYERINNPSCEIVNEFPNLDVGVISCNGGNK